MAVWKAFVERHPDCPQGWYYYAINLSSNGYHEAAVEAILKAKALDPQNFHTYAIACGVLGLAGRVEDLPCILEQMLERFPDRWETYTTVGLALAHRLGEFDRACELSARAVQLQPRLFHAWVHHGMVLELAGRLPEAITAFKQAWVLMSKPRDGNLASRVAMLYREIGNELEAHCWFERAVQDARELTALSPAKGHYGLAQALEALGDREGAIHAYRAALSYGIATPCRQEVEAALERLQKMVDG